MSHLANVLRVLGVHDARELTVFAVAVRGEPSAITYLAQSADVTMMITADEYRQLLAQGASNAVDTEGSNAELPPHPGLNIRAP